VLGYPEKNPKDLGQAGELFAGEERDINADWTMVK
jgi:hypothetical protein